MEIIFFWIIFVALVAIWASSWGRSGLLYFIAAFFLSPLVAGLILLIHGRKGKVCPKCRESVRTDAVVCKHCGYEFEIEGSPHDESRREDDTI